MVVLELRAPTARVKARVWKRQLERHGIEASPDDVRALATEFEATPGVASGATAAARLAGGDFAAVRHGVRYGLRALRARTATTSGVVSADPARPGRTTRSCTVR